ncbi:MAG TPA: circularly permuted type 2 ATP-grasp protein [Ohtaekwangia sp.]|uniref:circularly permuted type 2 ATP-grasp protein n=1 Tax=Ohtaekwangia sp. TaxID=2066019 RepID=UPI002F937DFA
MDRTNINASQSLITQDYFSNQVFHDECFGPNGEVREPWKRLLNNVEHLTPAELKNRQQELLKLLEENGVTYNVYGDPDGLNRPWLLDTLPLLIANAEWKLLEKGMKQRVTVLNMLLEDIYGEKRLLKEGIIPPELIYSHSGFLRPCDNIKLPGKNQLILYAADLSRGPNEKVWVLRDRTQAPSGMGYALENRSALNRVLPELFKDHHVNKLGGFFNSIMQAFLKISPHGKEQPRIVVLTPGPHNETYFEHAILASYLGFTLAQGDDLIVRNGFVWIKTVEGLEKVDIILRRVDDSFCDPLELREDSQLGIPGLLEVIRKGNVAVANPLGSSILENTGLLAFMHNVFQYFLKEDPIFPMVATWWCGQKKEMEYVISNIDSLVIKKTDRMTGSDTWIGHQLSKAEKEDLIRKIRFQPFLYAGQEAVNLSTSPVFTKGKLEPRYTVMRTFLVASEGSYQIMPGGLTRCSPEKGSLIVSNQEGGISKDTWIEVPAQNIDLTLLRNPDLRRKAVLPSRAAENLFWVGRYSQRVIRTSRFIRIVLRNLSQTNDQDSVAMKALLKTVEQLTATSDLVDKEENTADILFTQLHHVICNADIPGSILSAVNSLLRAMYSVRDRWTVDNWRIIDDIENVKRRLALLEPENIRHVFSLLDQLNLGLLSFLEMNRQSMYRDEGWNMYRIGQLLEEVSLEVIQYKTLLTSRFEENSESQILEALLASNLALSNYRSVNKTYFDTAPAIDLLFINKQNPISILSQLEQLLKYIEELPSRDNSPSGEIAALAFACYSKVRLINVDKLVALNKTSGIREELYQVCEELSNQIATLSVKLSAAYFSHSVYYKHGSDELQFEV